MKTKWILGLIFLWATASLHAQTYGQRVVAAVLLAEARSEGERGMIAVAEVIRNRADAWGVSPLAVVKVEKHFSCLNKTTPEALVRRCRGLPEWSLALAIARQTYNQPETLPGFANGANHFHSESADWADGEDPVAIIGRLKFYRLPMPSF